MPSLNTGNAILSNPIKVDSSYNVGIGGAATAGISLKNTKKLTGASTTYANYADGQIQTDATNLSHYFYSEANIIAATTATGIYHFKATQGTFGAGSSLTVQAGLVIDVSLSGATNNYGIISNINAADSNWNLYIGGTAKNWIASSLGIGSGTQTPTATLDVNGTLKASGAATFSSSVTAGGSVGVGGTNTDSLLTINGTAGTTHERFREGSTTVGFIGGANGIITGANGSLAIRGENGLVLSGQGNSISMFINGTTGNVGIGTSSPSERLHLANTTNGFVGLRLEGTGTYAGSDWTIYASSTSPSSANDFIGFFNNSTTDGATADYKLSIFKNGNVGIGTSSPFAIADVNLTVNGPTGAAIQLGYNGTRYGQFYAANDEVRLSAVANLPLTFYSNNLERMRITSGGSVLIGTTSTALLGLATIQYGTNSTSNPTLLVRNGGGSAAFVSFSDSDAATTLFGWIVRSGSGVNYASASDYRLKQDLKEYEGLSLISKIKTYDYEWKSDNSRSYGVIAHELQEVIPYAVTGEKDGENMQGVDYSKIVPVLVKAIQEQQAQIEAQQQQINSLINR